MLRLKIILQYNYIYYILFVLALFYSFLIFNFNTSKLNIDETNITGILNEYVIDGDKFSFVINKHEKVKCIYYIKTEEEKNYLSTLDLGIELKLNGSLVLPSNNTIPNTFNYKNYLKANNIYYQMNVDNLSVINNKTNIFYSIKNILIKYINTYKSRGYLNTFIIGNKNLLDDNTYKKYQELGVSHIFAISGMHVSIITSIILLILKKIRVKDNKAYVSVIIFLTFYLFITNYQASILRSYTLFILLYLNKRFDFNIKTINILMLAISLLLIIRPNLLFNIGFLYSSVVSYSLIKYNFFIKGNYLLKLFKVSFIAFLFSLPITMLNNYEINILSIINNLIIVPLISLIIYPLSLLTLIIKPLDIILYTLLDILELVAAKLFVFNIIILKINFVMVFLYYLIVIIFFKSYNKKILLLIPLMLLIYKYLNYFDNSYYVYYLDVSQGDSIVIKHKDESIMIDTGGKLNYISDEWKKKRDYHLSDNTIMFLKSIGIYNIDYLILTHGDYDHMGEAINLVNNFKVEKVILNCGEYNNLEKELIKVLDKKNKKYCSCIKELNIDKNKLYFLQTKEYDNENDNSNVIYTELNGYKFMFMGDASVTTEKEILDKYNLSDIDVLKVGHHGSKTSSGKEFINQIEPKYSVISVGKNNRYGHPNKETLENLKDTKIYRTDEDGSIIFKIKNNKLNIDTCSP